MWGVARVHREVSTTLLATIKDRQDDAPCRNKHRHEQKQKLPLHQRQEVSLSPSHKRELAAKTEFLLLAAHQLLHTVMDTDPPIGPRPPPPGKVEVGSQPCLREGGSRRPTSLQLLSLLPALACGFTEVTFPQALVSGTCV